MVKARMPQTESSMYSALLVKIPANAAGRNLDTRNIKEVKPIHSIKHAEHDFPDTLRLVRTVIKADKRLGTAGNPQHGGGNQHHIALDDGGAGDEAYPRSPARRDTAGPHSSQ